MDLSYSKEEVAFREEVRDFFATAVPADTRKKLQEGRHLGKEAMVTWQRILNKKGWAVPHWPKEWGGTGWSPVQLYIFKEEMQQAPAPEPLPFGVSMVGPVIIQFGRELFGRHTVSAATYARALTAFGERDLVDLVDLMAREVTNVTLLTAFDQR